MLQYSGVALTDEVNLYGHKFTIGGMYSAYDDVWMEGVPSYINHDHNKQRVLSALQGKRWRQKGALNEQTNICI